MDLKVQAISFVDGDLKPNHKTAKISKLSVNQLDQVGNVYRSGHINLTQITLSFSIFWVLFNRMKLSDFCLNQISSGF